MNADKTFEAVTAQMDAAEAELRAVEDPRFRQLVAIQTTLENQGYKLVLDTRDDKTAMEGVQEWENEKGEVLTLTIWSDGFQLGHPWR